MRRILFRIPFPGTEGLPIYSYGAMLMVGFLVALFLARRRARRAGMDPNIIVDLALVTLLSGVFGARLFYVFEFHEEFFGAPGGLLRALQIWHGGLVFYGGFLAAVPAVVIFTRVKKLRLLRVLDIIAPSVMIGLACGRIGCFLNGCCYGRPSQVLGVVFPEGGFAYQPPNALPPGTAIYPSQIHSSLAALLIYVILELYFDRSRRPGRVALLLCILYPIHRVTIEILRADTHVPAQQEGYLDPQTFSWGGFSTSQVVSLAVFLAAVSIWVFGKYIPLKHETRSRSERRAEERRRRKLDRSRANRA